MKNLDEVPALKPTPETIICPTEFHKPNLYEQKHKLRYFHEISPFKLNEIFVNEIRKMKKI